MGVCDTFCELDHEFGSIQKGGADEWAFSGCQQMGAAFSTLPNYGRLMNREKDSRSVREASGKVEHVG